MTTQTKAPSATQASQWLVGRAYAEECMQHARRAHDWGYSNSVTYWVACAKHHRRAARRHAALAAATGAQQ